MTLSRKIVGQPTVTQHEKLTKNMHQYMTKQPNFQNVFYLSHIRVSRFGPNFPNFSPKMRDSFFDNNFRGKNVSLTPRGYFIAILGG